MTTPPRAPGGAASRRQVAAINRIEDAERAVAASLPLMLKDPEPADEAIGAVKRFVHEADGWIVTGTISRGNRGLIVSSLGVNPPRDQRAPNGVTTRFLQKLPVEKILAAVRAQAALEEAKREGTRAFTGEEPVSGAFLPSDVEDVADTGRRNAVTDDLLRQVAEAYLEETAPGREPGALRRMAERFSRPEKTIQGWVSRARRAGWLGPGARGRSGAEPGPRLTRVRMEESMSWGQTRERKPDEPYV